MGVGWLELGSVGTRCFAWHCPKHIKAEYGHIEVLTASAASSFFFFFFFGTASVLYQEFLTKCGLFVITSFLLPTFASGDVTLGAY